MSIAEAQFLAHLTDLSRDYGIVIGACGCCGSPWLNDEPKPLKGRYVSSEEDRTMSEGFGWKDDA